MTGIKTKEYKNTPTPKHCLILTYDCITSDYGCKYHLDVLLPSYVGMFGR